MKRSIHTDRCFSAEPVTVLPKRKQHLLLFFAIIAPAVTAVSVRAVCPGGCFYSNTYQGPNALLNFGSGGQETAFGASALNKNLAGTDNSAIGAFTMAVNTYGYLDTA